MKKELKKIVDFKKVLLSEISVGGEFYFDPKGDAYTVFSGEISNFCYANRFGLIHSGYDSRNVWVFVKI